MDLLQSKILMYWRRSKEDLKYSMLDTCRLQAKWCFSSGLDMECKSQQWVSSSDRSLSLKNFQQKNGYFALKSLLSKIVMPTDQRFIRPMEFFVIRIKRSKSLPRFIT